MVDIKEELQEIKEILKESQQEKKPKKFRMPWKGKVSPKKAKLGYVTVMKINENGFLDIKRKIIEQQTVMVDGVPRLATPEYVLHYKKNPVLILPSWSVKPYSPAERYEHSLQDGSNTKGYKLLMSRMKTETTGLKKQMGGLIKWILGLGLIAIVGYAMITGGGG